jgi:hypothetical protein
MSAPYPLRLEEKNEAHHGTVGLKSEEQAVVNSPEW